MWPHFLSSSPWGHTRLTSASSDFLLLWTAKGIVEHPIPWQNTPPEHPQLHPRFSVPLSHCWLQLSLETHWATSPCKAFPGPLPLDRCKKLMGSACYLHAHRLRKPRTFSKELETKREWISTQELRTGSAVKTLAAKVWQFRSPEPTYVSGGMADHLQFQFQEETEFPAQTSQRFSVLVNSRLGREMLMEDNSWHQPWTCKFMYPCVHVCIHTCIQTNEKSMHMYIHTKKKQTNTKGK